jgi:hypothetical protein
MKDALHVHHDESLDDLFEDAQYLLRGELLILLFEVIQQIAVLAVLHDDLE